MYCVNFWGSHPDAENDDCWTGYDFATREEAEACFRAEPRYENEGEPTFRYTPLSLETAYVELDGPDVYEVRKNPGFSKRAKSDDSDWESEIRMQAGMGGGCGWYNDAL